MVINYNEMLKRDSEQFFKIMYSHNNDNQAWIIEEEL